MTLFQFFFFFGLNNVLFFSEYKCTLACLSIHLWMGIMVATINSDGLNIGVRGTSLN